ncbi:Piso0_005741 [Millerozyma farinosa CBS 7064]|uniref:Piso0_005741 protein n=1 Tax=Pichia sorbitophila (strain ATCC MYA-4447 / BCRC 22081 / CBS 7064 / NBRC 10061 / NRRL Y-12695) TaxID=559304 RepID=G8XZT9_PICSO|nr:Piso0_005741 [Millerozyma farinosa CBS 7064]
MNSGNENSEEPPLGEKHSSSPNEAEPNPPRPEGAPCPRVEEMNQNGEEIERGIDIKGNAPGYFDSNWASNFLMDPNNDLFYNMDLEAQNNGVLGNMAYEENLSESHLTGVHSNGIMDKSQQNIEAMGTSSDSLKGMANIPSNQQKGSKQRRPCDRCRKRKTKCVVMPEAKNCVQCEAKSLTCTFIGQAIKRKPGPDIDMDVKRLKPGNNATAEDPGYNSQNNRNASEIVPPDVPIRDVPPVQDYSTMNNSLLKKTLSLQFPRSSFYIGPTSCLYDTNLLNLMISAKHEDARKDAGMNNSASKIEQLDINNSTTVRKVSGKVHFVLKDDQSAQSYQSMSNDVDAIEKFIAPHGQILIDLYFRIIHPSYPILHKKVFLEKYSRTHREFSAPLLAAVYVLAIQWWDYDPQLNKFPRPNVNMIFKIGLNNYLLEILKRPKLSAVQAGLLLLQCKHMIRDSNDSNSTKSPTDSATESNNIDSNYSDWVLCSQIIALSEELGLGLDCNDWKLPKWERCLRKRLAWAVFMEDKWLSLKNSRPSHVNESNWFVKPLVEDDFPEKHGDGDLKEGSSDIDNGKKIFMSLCNLTKILSDILDSFYTMKAMNEVRDINQVLQLAKPLQLKLKNWYHSLPTELHMSSVKTRKLCSNGYLHLAYFATELTLHRKIMITIYQMTNSGNPPPAELVGVCRTAAKARSLASIDFLRDLKPEHIHSFWHSSTLANITLIGTFAALLFITALSNEEREFYKDQIFNYRWILKISSKSFDQAGEALIQLDSVISNIPGLLSDNTDMPITVPDVPMVNFTRGANQIRMPVGETGQPQNGLKTYGPKDTHDANAEIAMTSSNENLQFSFNPELGKPGFLGSNDPKKSPQMERFRTRNVSGDVSPVMNQNNLRDKDQGIGLHDNDNSKTPRHDTESSSNV